MSAGDVHRSDMPDALDAFLDDLRAVAADVPAPAPGVELTTLFHEGAAPVAARRPARRWAVGAAVFGAVASVGFGGLGVAGALPAPVQARVADMAEQLGIDLPDGRADESPRPARTTTTTTVTVRPTTTTTVSPSADAPGRTGDAPGRTDERPGRSDETPGRSDQAPGRITTAPGSGRTIPTTTRGRSSTTPRRGHDVPAKTAEVAGVAELGRNPNVMLDVDPFDRPGPRPADDGGALR